MMLPESEMREIQVLLVEDDDIDAMAFHRHLRNAKINARVHRAIDGTEALALLRGTADAEPLASPYIILLDLNMPRMTGLEFLEELRNDDRLRGSVVFVFTTSNAQEDRRYCFQHNVAAYLLKSRVGERQEKLMALLESYADVAELPARSG